MDHEGHIGEGHELSPTFTGEFINVGTYENQFTLDIVDKDGNSVLEFYREIEYKFGTVEITRRTIVIKPVSRKEQYTGEPLYALEEIVVPNEYLDELNGNFYGYVYTYSVDDMSDTFINLPGEELRFKIPAERFHIYLDGEALDMSNFEIISEEAYLKLAEKLVEINVFKISKSYSGKLVSYREDDWYLRDGQLPEGYTLDLKLSGGLIEAGVIDFDELLETIVALDSIHVYDENGNDVTYRYDFKFVGTPLTVTERALQITAGSASKYHDGEPLTYNEYKITGGSLARGHSIKACIVSGSVTDVGTTINIISDVVIVDENGNNVTSNYDIDTVSGVLEVLENPQENNQ